MTHLLVKVELEVYLDLPEVEAVHDVHVLPQLPGVVVGDWTEEAHSAPELIPPVAPLPLLPLVILESIDQ